ncbi:hypothetical protein Bhyg_04333 [Pseudolycoriella hygida]|uniref:Uncharacterized protein n=1 Tax=Pseudolycoriella hygida TaxID=35572 RepID=A0A9Q0SA01_9DIPT|nr:hypothetical protein Bhyg_04333 [Pseudolycoriella hygida]
MTNKLVRKYIPNCKTTMNAKASPHRSQLQPPSRRRPPTRIATPTMPQKTHIEADSNIMRINIPGNPQTTPVFVSRNSYLDFV